MMITVKRELVVVSDCSDVTAVVTGSVTIMIKTVCLGRGDVTADTFTQVSAAV